MTDDRLMQGFPPPAEAQVTLANWREAPFSRWSFRNVRRLLPTAGLTPGPAPRPLAEAPRALDRLTVGDMEGRPQPLRRFLDETHSDAFVVLHRGRLIYEWYAGGMGPADSHIIFSITKSLTGALAGILVDRGLFDPEAPIESILPEVRGSAYEGATVRHLLDMSVGTGFVEDYANPTAEYLRYRESTAWNPSAAPELVDMRSFLTGLSRGGPAHGHAFHYVSPNSDLLGWVLERAAGRSFEAMLAEEIWQPMGATGEAYITVDRLGAPRTAGGLCVTARDLARFGELMRRRGCLADRQILPGWWVDDIRTAGDRGAWQRGEFASFLPEGGYRSQWYQLGDDGAFCGIGIHGQWLYVDPDTETVLVKLSAHPQASSEGTDQMLLAAYRSVAAAL